MENIQFDNEIKKMLKDLEVPSQDMHWDSMAKRLQETKEPNTPDEVTAFDLSISEKMAGIHIPFNEASWMALRTRLIASAYLKKWVFQIKTIEGLFMLALALFLIKGIEDTPKAPTYIGPVAKVTSDQKSDLITEKTATIINQSTDVEFESHQAASAKWVNAEDNRLVSNSATNTIDRPTTPLLQRSDIPLLKSNTALPIILASKSMARSNSMPVTAPLSNPVGMLENNSKVVLTQLGNDSRGRFGLSVYGIINADHIVTGIDPTHNISVPNVWSPGYGGGIAFSKNYGRLNVSTGVEYQAVKYSPRPIIQVTQGAADLGYAGAGTTTVELTKVNVPITAGYTFVKGRKHRVGVEVGLLPSWGRETFEQSTYVLGEANEINEQVLLQKITETGSQPSVYVTQPVQSVNTEPQQVDARITESVKFYAFARANISYEYRLNTHHSIFAKASYSHQLSQNGIGLPKDQLNTIGLHFGSRVYL